MNLLKKFYKLFIIIILITSYFVVRASATDGIINSTNHSALLCGDDACVTTTQINFKTTLGTPIHITDTNVTGNAWSETFGWINFNPTHGGITNNGSGILGGDAWGENAGWINFNPTHGGVTINNNGQFIGWAWAQNYGWIRFNCATTNACVETDWRPLSVRNNNSGGGNGGGSGGSSSGGSGTGAGNNAIDICPNILGTQSIIPEGLVISAKRECISPQQCNLLDGALKQPLDVIVIIDKSGSMAGTKLLQAKNAATAFINNLVLGSDRVGYVSYSNSATLESGLTSSFDSVKIKINKTTVINGTNIGGAVKIAYQELNTNGRSGVKHVIIVLTDGEANISDVKNVSPNQYAINQSNLAKIDGMIVYSVGLGTSVNASLLRSISTLSSNYYYSPTGEDLSSIYLKIAAIECTAAPSRVSDFVIYDKNNNGLQDAGEVGFANVQISLISKDGVTQTRDATSTSDGSFIFNNVTQGQYQVCVSIPSGMNQTYPASSGCYSINVIQGINVNSTRFMISGKVLNPIVPVTPVIPPVNPKPPVVTPPINPTSPTSPPVVNPNPPVISPTTPVVPSVNPPADTFPPIDGVNPVVLPSDTNNNQGTNNNTFSNYILNKLDNFIGSILGSSTGSGLAITQNSIFDTKENINALIYMTELFTKEMVDTTSKIFKDPIGKAVTETVATTGALTGAYFGVVNVAFANPVTFSEIFLTPMRLWSLILIALGIKKRRYPWGTVYDSVTKQPLDPVYVILQDLNGNEVATSITDLDGRYGFLVPTGQYRILTHKTNYEFPSKKLSGKSNDELYQELYFNEIIDVKEGGLITKNIPMDPIKFDWNEFAKKDKKLMRFFSRRELIVSRLANILFAIGFIFTVISTLITPSFYNILILSLYLFMVILKKTILKPRAYGYVKEKETKNPLPFAIIRVFFAGQENEIIHKVTDQSGKYYCLIPNGTYYTKIENKNLDETYSLVNTSEPIEVKKGYINKKFEV